MAEVEQESLAKRWIGRGDLVSNVLMLVAASVSIGGFGVLFSLLWNNGITDPRDMLRVAAQEYVSGNPIVAGELAESVEFEALPEIPDPPPDDFELARSPLKAADIRKARAAREEQLQWVRLRDFLVGVGNVAKARREDSVRKRRLLLLQAIPALEDARDAGFPPGHYGDGHKVLGNALFEVGRYDDAIAAFEAAIERDPTLRRESLPKLAEAQLKSLAPIDEQALATIKTFLDDPTLPPESRREGELIHLRALIELDRYEEAEQIVRREFDVEMSEQVDRDNELENYRNELLLLQAIAKIQHAIDRYGPLPNGSSDDRSALAVQMRGPLTVLSDLQRDASAGISARARLWAARAQLVQGKVDTALTQLTAVRQQRPFGAAAILGGLEEIELLAGLGRGLEAVLTARFVMRELGDARGFDSELISFAEFRRRLVDAIEVMRRNGEHENAIDAARCLSPVFDKADALVQEGIGFRQWAAQTILDGTDSRGQVARNASEVARARFRAAGDAFAEAAHLQFDTEEYLPTQWSAIDAYQKGRHFTQSIRLLEPYLRYEQRRNKPRGLLAYGRALLAEDRPDEAIDALTTCIIEFPRDPLRYDARLLAALAYAEKTDLQNARKLLVDNLQDGALTPRSPAWQDSLMTLGELLYQRGYHNYLQAQQAEEPEKITLLKQNQPILEEAVRYLDEAVERYWEYPRAKSAAYLSARAHLLSSQWPRIESQSPEILDAARRALTNQADQDLHKALDGFSMLREFFTSLEEDQRLSEGEAAMLRNCHLAEADVLREMDRFDEAAETYRAVELRYMNEPTALEAILGRARCARRLGRPQEADQLVRQAALVLQRIPTEWDGKFDKITRYDREGWDNFLTWMTQRMDNNTTLSQAS